MADGRHLGASEEPLATAYDLAMLDLDGVVYIGGEAVPGAAEHLADAREDRDPDRVRHQQRLAATR